MAVAKVWFSDPVAGVDPFDHDEFVSTRHVVYAARLVQDQEATTFVDDSGEVLATWATDLVLRVEWVDDEPPSEDSPRVGTKEWLANAREEHPRAYLPWSTEDDERLRTEYADGTPTAEIARLHQRKPSAIRSRLIKLGLIDRTSTAPAEPPQDAVSTQ